VEITLVRGTPFWIEKLAFNIGRKFILINFVLIELMLGENLSLWKRENF
jgi:hypothetical protein